MNFCVNECRGAGLLLLAKSARIIIGLQCGEKKKRQEEGTQKNEATHKYGNSSVSRLTHTLHTCSGGGLNNEELPYKP